MGGKGFAGASSLRKALAGASESEEILHDSRH